MLGLKPLLLDPITGTGYNFGMRVISRGTLRAFWEKHSDAEGPLQAWFHQVRRENWKTPADVRNAYGNASIIANNRVVFNIKGNDYRLIVRLFSCRNNLYPVHWFPPGI